MRRQHLLRTKPGCPPFAREFGSQAAFTIVEVIMAMVVLTFGIMTALVAGRACTREMDYSRMSNASTQAMQSEIERIRLLSWTDLGSLSTPATLDLTQHFPADAQLTRRLNVVRAISDVTGTGTPASIKEITFTATWNGIDGKPRTRVFKMRYARNGLYDYYYSAS